MRAENVCCGDYPAGCAHEPEDRAAFRVQTDYQDSTRELIETSDHGEPGNSMAAGENPPADDDSQEPQSCAGLHHPAPREAPHNVRPQKIKLLLQRDTP